MVQARQALGRGKDEGEIRGIEKSITGFIVIRVWPVRK
jgi:hypothetical protein